MHPMQQDADIIIAGAGLVGSALAIALAREGLDVIVADPLPAEKQLESAFDGRVSAIAIASKRILEGIGAWAHVAEAEPIYDIRVVDGTAPMQLHFDHKEVGREPFGYMVENQRLRRALFEATRQQPRIRFLSGEEVTGFEVQPGHVAVRLRSGEVKHAPLLVAADGRFSKLRDQAGLPYRIIEYGQIAMVTTVAHSKPHRGLALERFLPPGPFAVLPMTDNRSCIVWSESERMAPHYMQLPEADFAAEIAKRMGPHWGDVTLAGKRFSYPLKLMFARSMVSDRFALIGDAAHGIHPIAGQGVNLGYRDVAVLTEMLAGQKRLGLDMGDADLLARYERRRRMDSLSMTAMTDGLDRLFSNNIPGVRLARRLGLALVDRFPPAKHRLMRHAMGLVGDLPALMKPPEAA